MQLRSIDITRFRHFDALHLHDIGPGLVVVSGPNEAGKSTLREFITWMLFGRRGGRIIEEGQGKIGLRVGDRALVLHRHDALVEVDEPHRPTKRDAALLELLGGTDAALFSAIFAFDANELQSLQSLDKESVHRQLALAGLVGGAKQPSKVVADLKRYEDTQWRPRARDGSLHVARDRATKLTRELLAAQAEVKRLPELALAHARATATLADVEREHEALEVRRHALRIFIEAWPREVELTSVQVALSELAPTPWSARDLERARDAAMTLDGARAQYADATVKREAAERYMAELAPLGPHLTVAADIEAAALRLSELDQLIQRRATVAASEKTLDDEVARGLVDLALPRDTDLGALAEGAQRIDLDELAAFAEASAERLAAGRAAHAQANDSERVCHEALAVIEHELDQLERTRAADAATLGHRAVITVLQHDLATMDEHERHVHDLGTQIAALDAALASAPSDFSVAVEPGEGDALDEAIGRRERAIAELTLQRANATQALGAGRARVTELERALAGLPEEPADLRVSLAVVREAAREHRAATEELHAVMLAERDSSEERHGEDHVSELERQRDDAVALRAAFVELREVEADAAKLGVLPRATRWLPWVAVAGFVVIATVAAALAQWLLVALGLVVALVFGVLARRERLKTRPVALTSDAEARRRVDELARAVGLPASPRRDAIDVAVERASGELARAQRRAEEGRERARERAQSAARKVVLQEARAAALARCGGPEVDPTRVLAELEQAVARAQAHSDRRAELNARLGEAKRALDEAERAHAALQDGSGDALELARWSALTTARKWPEAPPDERYRERVQRAVRHTQRTRERAQIAGEASRVRARLTAFDERLSAILGDDRGTSRAERVFAVAAQLDHATERHARRERLVLAHSAARAEHERAVSERRRADAELERLAELADRFAAWREHVGAPPDLVPEEASRWARRVREIGAAARSLVHARGELSMLADHLDELVRLARTLAESLAEAVPLTPVDAHHTITAAAQTLAAERTLKAQRKERSNAYAACRAAEKGARGTVETAETELRLRLEALGLERGADIVPAAERLRERARLEAEQLRCSGELAKVAGALTRDERFIAELATGELVGWRNELAATDERVRELVTQREARRRERAALEHEQDRIEASVDVVRIATELADATDVLKRAEVEYAQTRIARYLLEETFADYRRRRQPEVLARASEWMTLATDGVYVAIESVEGPDPLDLQLRDAGGAAHAISAGLSAGTLALVYLCLRMSLALDHGAQARALPLFLDDVFVHFDPERAQAAAKIVAAVATATQVWVSTCRPETAALLHAADPTATAIVLQRWGGRAGPARRRVATEARATVPQRLVAAASVPSSTDDELADALGLLRERRVPLKKSDFTKAFNWNESTWNDVRVRLEAAADVLATGSKNGARYEWCGGDEHPAAAVSVS